MGLECGVEEEWLDWRRAGERERFRSSAGKAGLMVLGRGLDAVPARLTHGWELATPQVSSISWMALTTGRG